MASEFPNKYDDPLYASLDAQTEQKLGLPVGLLNSIRTNGEKSNNDQVSDAKATTPYQFIPATRKAILDKYGIDVSLNPQNASEGAGLLLKEGLDRNKGDASQAVGEYIGGLDRNNWGKTTNAYINRVMVGQQPAKTDALSNGFAKFLADNPAIPAGRSTGAGAPAPADAPKLGSLESGFSDWLKKKESGYDASQIPGQTEGAPSDVSKAVPEPSLGQKIVGTGEAALNAVTGLTGGTVGAIGGTIGGIYDAATTPGLTPAQMDQRISQGAERGSQALTYQPRTASGQDQAAAVGNVMQNAVPLMGMSGEMASLGHAVQAATPAAQVTAAAIPAVARDAVGTAATNVAQGVGKVVPQVVKDIPGKVSEMMGREPAAPSAGSPTPGTLGSVGAAGVDMATQRRMAAQELPVPLDITEGMATRDFGQQRFEKETAKHPELGAPLRERVQDLNRGILQNFDAMVDLTGSEAPDLRTAGTVVTDALRAQLAKDKTKVRVAYKEAEKAGEMGQPVSLSPVVDYLNQSAPDAATAPILNAARQWALKLGIATEDNGTLIPASKQTSSGLMNSRPSNAVTLKTAETFRQAINRATDFEPTNVRQATIIKQLVDSATENAGGDLYRAARAERARMAENYQNHAAISDLIGTKRGTGDRQVAVEDVFRRTILNGSVDDIRQVRRVLQRSGDQGTQAWKELQGQTLKNIKEQATGSARDSAGNPTISAHALNKAVTTLDKSGKLDFIFGKKGAETIRTLNDVVNSIRTSPEGAVNTSSTAAVLLAALDMGISGAGGMPLPVASGLRLVVNNIKDRRIRQRVNAALGVQPARKTIH